MIKRDKVMRNNTVISCDFEDTTLPLLQFLIDNFSVSIRDIGYVFEEFISNTISYLQSREIISEYWNRPDIIDDEVIETVENELGYITEIIIHDMFSIHIDSSTQTGLNDAVCLLLEMQNISGITSGYYIIENGKYISEYDIGEVIGFIYTDLLHSIFIELVDSLCTIIMLAIYNEVFFEDAVISGNKLLVIFSVDNEIPPRHLISG